MTNQGQSELHVCPVCGTSNTLESLSKREYRCEHCNLELAHLDIAANGVIRGIFGWLHTEGDIIEDRYRVKSVLGRGGFGATYLVEDTRLSGKRRALKEVPELLFDEYETTLLSQLNHPAIPDIIDRSVVNGMVYLVLEFGGSRTLSGERKQYQGRIPQTKLLPWMRQLCEVLIYLHSQDPPIIHRDLKPDNILLDENGRIMLIDFGIAKEAKPATMTRTIGRAATHGFSPPEQAMGTGTDERSDIYALAATFYALLTGESPPAAHERVAGKEIVPPSQIVPDIAPQLEAAILKALNLNVNHRQQTMKEFSQSLETIALSTHDFMPHTAEYTERTVMINRTIGVTDPTELHPPSIKLPRGQISIEKSIPSSVVATSQQASKRNLILLLSGIAIVFAAILIAYWFWFKTPSSVVNPVESTDKESIGEITVEEKKTNPEKKEPASLGIMTITDKKLPGEPSIKVESKPKPTSALEALKQEQGNPNEMDDETSMDENKRMKEKARIKAEIRRADQERHDADARAARKAADEEKKRREAAKKKYQPPLNPTDWPDPIYKR